MTFSGSSTGIASFGVGEDVFEAPVTSEWLFWHYVSYGEEAPKNGKHLKINSLQQKQSWWTWQNPTKVSSAALLSQTHLGKINETCTAWGSTAPSKNLQKKNKPSPSVSFQSFNLIRNQTEKQQKLPPNHLFFPRQPEPNSFKTYHQSPQWWDPPGTGDSASLGWDGGC